jgi:anti-sigma factor ChrR (cupin superfamily)
MFEEVHLVSTDETAEYAALYCLGDLSPEDRKNYEKHLSVCGSCRSEVEGYSAVMDELALAESGNLSSELRAVILARVHKQARSFMGVGTLLRAGGSDWQKSPIPGVQIRNLYEQKTFLIRMAPKTSYPAHDHPEAEQCLVLEGSITSEGVTAYVGDFTYMPAGSSHHPLYSENGCLLLIAYT